MEKVMYYQKFLFVICVCTLMACKEKATEVNQAKEIFFSYETSSCISPALLKGTTVFPDSVFSYSFSDNLTMDFSSISNCCPDSNRFVLDHEIRQDTIIITVTDTAQNLCRCICLYMIHSEITGLPMNQYVIRCRFIQEHYMIDPTHLVTVIRK